MQQTIRAISLWEPYASYIRVGMKKIETRTWPTKYRGEILIHASQRKLTKSKQELAKEHFAEYGHDFKPLYGNYVAIATLSDCVAMTDNFIKSQTTLEIILGGWVTGNYAWVLENIRPCVLTPDLGKQGLWIPGVIPDVIS